MYWSRCNIPLNETLEIQCPFRVFTTLWIVKEPVWTPDGCIVRGKRHHVRRYWWSQPESNRRPPACKAGALPAELWPLSHVYDSKLRRICTDAYRMTTCTHGHSSRTVGSACLVGLGRFELPTSPLSGVRSNRLSYRPAMANRQSQANCVGAYAQERASRDEIRR